MIYKCDIDYLIIAMSDQVFKISTTLLVAYFQQLTSFKAVNKKFCTLNDSYLQMVVPVYSISFSLISSMIKIILNKYY